MDIGASEIGYNYNVGTCGVGPVPFKYTQAAYSDQQLSLAYSVSSTYIYEYMYVMIPDCPAVTR